MLSLVTGCVNQMSGYFFSKQPFQDITDSVMRNAAHKALWKGKIMGYKRRSLSFLKCL